MNSKSYSLNGNEVTGRRLVSFLAVKYIGLGFAAFLLVGAIILLPLGPNAIDNYLDDQQISEEAIQNLKSSWYWAAVFTLILSGLGTWGIFKEKLLLSAIYSLYLLFSLFGSIFASSVWSSSPIPLVCLAFFTGWSLIFCFLLLRKSRGDVHFDSPPQYAP